MGQTLQKLSKKELTEKAIFNNRFVIEICEKVHFHYRNLRLILSKEDWIELAKGCKDSLERWTKLGSPEPKEGVHIELCRKEVAKQPLFDNEIAINLNKNLYEVNEGKIYSEGAGLDGKTYVHLKIRDQRLELKPSEFMQLADAIIEAKEQLCLEPQS